MTITQNYRNAFSEVYTILKYIEQDDYKKIPSNIISVIKEKQNLDYKYKMNKDVDIFSQPMLPETKAILFNLYRDYWATEEQRDKIIRAQQQERIRLENEKKERYKSEDIFKNNNKVQETKDVVLIDVKKEKWYKKIIKFFKKITE